MAQTTKKELIEIITNILRKYSENEVRIVKYQNTLRNGRWGLRAFTLCYNSGEVMCRPWNGANVYWRANLNKLKLAELRDVVGRCIMLTKDKIQ